MDPLTHTLMGAVTAQTGFRQRIGRDATWVAAAAAIVPDFDIFLAPLLSLTGMEVGELGNAVLHRGISHSFLVVPLLSLAVAVAWWTFRRRVRRGQADGPAQRPPAGFGLLYACVLVAMVSHVLLDWCTSYGTQILSPLTDERFALDAAPIVDFFLTPALAVTLLICWGLRKVLGGERSAKPTLVVGWFGALASLGYLGAGGVLHDRAVAKAVRLVGDEKVIRADAYPMIGAIFLWRTVVETDAAWHVARVHHFGSAAPSDVRQTVVAKAVPNDWVRRALALPGVQAFDWFCMHRMRPTYAREDGRHAVEFHDMRYGIHSHGIDSIWTLRVTFSANGGVLGVQRAHHYRRAGRMQLLRQAWDDLWQP